MNMILEGLNESRIDEAQKIHVVRYKNNGAKDAQLICNTKQYNKVSKTQGFKELDHAEIDKSDIKLHSNSIKGFIEKYGLGDGFSPDSDGEVVGTFGNVGYGYILYKDSKIKPYGYGFEK